MDSYYVTQLGQTLQEEVDRQLLEDLRCYGVTNSNLSLEWYDACGEGHVTEVMGGRLEGVSSLVVLDGAQDKIAEGWMDFIHGIGDGPLYVFWLFLSIWKNGKRIEVKSQHGIPNHLWERLPDETKQICAKADGYDARWAKESHVLAWKREQYLTE